MPSEKSTPLQILLIADDSYRIAMLRRAMKNAGLNCRISRLPQTRTARAFLNRKQLADGESRPDLVFQDFACDDNEALDTLSVVAFGASRSRVPVVILTSPATEEMLQSGDLDDGRSIMFSPRPLESLLRKLADNRGSAFIAAVRTLYQYGPILARLPQHFFELSDDSTQLSA